MSVNKAIFQLFPCVILYAPKNQKAQNCARHIWSCWLHDMLCMFHFTDGALSGSFGKVHLERPPAHAAVKALCLQHVQEIECCCIQNCEVGSSLRWGYVRLHVWHLCGISFVLVITWARWYWLIYHKNMLTIAACQTFCICEAAGLVYSAMLQYANTL